MTNLVNVGARFGVTRMFPNTGPLPAHVFVVYDTPVVKKRIEFGFDGRSSTLAPQLRHDVHSEERRQRAHR